MEFTFCGSVERGSRMFVGSLFFFDGPAFEKIRVFSLGFVF